MQAGETVDSESRTVAWRALERDARQAHSRAWSALSGATARRQGTSGEITALDFTAVDTKRIARDPAGLTKPPKTHGDVHAELLRLAAAAIDAEVAAIRRTVSSIEERIGEGQVLDLERVEAALQAAVKAARKAHVLRPPDALSMIRAVELADNVAAKEVLEDARKAIASAKKGVSLDALARIARLDRESLTSIESYLDVVAEVAHESQRAAREVSGGGNDDSAGSVGDARNAIRATLAVVDQLIAAASEAPH
jgi:hypothetical protein